MKLSDFDYQLPKELIAQYPLTQRDRARLLVLDRKKGTIFHRVFGDICEYLGKDDLLIINDTKVVPCRLNGRRASGGKAEVFLVRQKEGPVFSVMLKPARLKAGEKIIFDTGQIYARIDAKDQVTFNTADIDKIYALGVMPLPPYIKRPAEESDNEYYQTVYAAKEGAVASPTAGLHFTEGLMKKINERGTDIGHITLHVGPETFRPVKTEDITRHRMDLEYFQIPKETANKLDQAKREGKRTIAVGTTSLRAIESYARGTKEGFTDLFIFPGFEFNMADCLLTNFHLPKTTLFMLVCAFAGEKSAKKAYAEAISGKYRFYSYGDAMLVL